MQTVPENVKEHAAPHWAGSGLVRLGARALDWIYPPVCLHCAEPVVVPDSLCAACFRAMQPITRPFCPVLGLPFAADIGPEARSAQAIADPPPYRRARSAYVYNDTARALVGRFKYRDRPEVARFLARAMLSACADILDDKPVLVPVPLHRGRLWARRYNQSLELARQLARLTGLDLAPGVVRRIRPTRQQVGLGSAQRARNVAGAFQAAPDAFELIAGRPVALIDDVITTGATVGAVTRALTRAGVLQIDVMSFARVVLEEEMPT